MTALGDGAFGGTHEVSSAVYVISGSFDLIFGEEPGSFE